MRNLKKVLALTVALVMALGLMTVGLAAEDYTKYTDADTIVYKDAVSMLTAMSIISGKGSGQFDPKGNLTRAEVSKMTYVMNNNAVDDKAVLYKTAACTLTDANVPDWAEGYIKYCFTKGIVSGTGANQFKGNDTITGTQMLKMLLVALGYNAVKEGFVGAGWISQVAIAAQNAGLTENVETVDMSGPISREVAAQLIYNTLFATEVHYVDGVIEKRLGVDNHTPLTFARDKLGLYVVDGILIANDVVAIENQPICETGKSTIRISNPNYYSGSSNIDQYVPITIKATTDIGLIGHNVNAYVKLKSGENETRIGYRDIFDKVFGEVVDVPGRNKVTYAISNDYETKNFKSNTGFYVNYFGRLPGSEDKPGSYYTKDTFNNYYMSATPYDRANGKDSIGQQVIMVSNDGNDSVEYVFGMDKKFGEVTTYSSNRLSLTKNTSSNYRTSFYSVDFEDIINESNFALGDKALMWKIYQSGNYYMEKPGTLTGTMTGSTATSTGPKAIIGGKNIGVAIDHIAADDVIISDFVNKELTYYLDGDMICGVNEKGINKTSDKYCVVRGSYASGFLNNEGRARIFRATILTSDGYEWTKDIEKVETNGNYGTSKSTHLTDINGAEMDVTGSVRGGLNGGSVYYLRNDDAGQLAGGTVGNLISPIDNRVFKYTLNASDKLVLTEANIYGAVPKQRVKEATSVDFEYLLAEHGRPTTKGQWDANDNNPDVSERFERGRQTTDIRPTKTIDANTVAFIRSTRLENDKTWYRFQGYKDIPEYNGWATSSEQMRSFSAILGKNSDANLVKAFAVANGGYDKTSDTGTYYGVILYASSSLVSGSTWNLNNFTVFDGSKVVTYKGKSDLQVDTNDLAGWNINALRGSVVKYTLSGGLIDTLEFVNLMTTGNVTKAGGMIDVGYISTAQTSKASMFRMADFLVTGKNAPSVTKDLFPTDTMKVITLADMNDVTADNVKDSYSETPDTAAETEPIKDSVFGANKNVYQYTAVAIHDSTNQDKIKGVVRFNKIQEINLKGDAYKIMLADQFSNAMDSVDIRRDADVRPDANDFMGEIRSADWTVSNLPTTWAGYTVDWRLVLGDTMGEAGARENANARIIIEKLGAYTNGTSVKALLGRGEAAVPGPGNAVAFSSLLHLEAQLKDSNGNVVFTNHEVKAANPQDMPAIIAMGS